MRDRAGAAATAGTISPRALTEATQLSGYARAGSPRAPVRIACDMSERRSAHQSSPLMTNGPTFAPAGAAALSDATISSCCSRGAPRGPERAKLRLRIVVDERFVLQTSRRGTHSRTLRLGGSGAQRQRSVVDIPLGCTSRQNKPGHQLNCPSRGGSRCLFGKCI